VVLYDGCVIVRVLAVSQGLEAASHHLLPMVLKHRLLSIERPPKAKVTRSNRVGRANFSEITICIGSAGLNHGCLHVPLTFVSEQCRRGGQFLNRVALSQYACR
jgi:hypothetical protein